MLKLKTPPAVEPLTLTEVKLHLRLDSGTAEDTLLTGLIKVAREYCETFQRRAYITQTWRYWLDKWPDPISALHLYSSVKVNMPHLAPTDIKIPLPQLQSVTAITYYDTPDAPSTMAASDYFVDTVSAPGRVVLTYGKFWPSITLRPANGICIEFVAGYGDSADLVPQSAKQAMLLLIGQWYENREATGQVSKELEFTVNALLWPDRCF